MKKHINNGSVNECSTERGECEGVSFVQLERLLCTYVGVGEKEEKGAGCAWSLGGIALKLSSWYVSLRSIVVGENTYSEESNELKYWKTRGRLSEKCEI
ncbi:hypothetical protein V1477_004525 [Vespula maculifrons]|uniref:Uncharacterized protein n=1 Tax=Vespula maculifrons TaxID=7453 RepID=A0ABD2CN47_VESMC